MKASHYVFIALMLLFIFLYACTDKDSSSQSEINVFAASSLTHVVKEAEQMIESERQDLDLVLHFGSSSHLVEQIKRGASFDLFLSASEWDMAELIESGLIAEETVENFTYNDLAVITSNRQKVKDLSSYLEKGDVQYFAIGETKSVPLGRYTKKALIGSGVWAEVKSKFVFGKNALQVFKYVDSGQAEIAVVYGSDARFNDYPNKLLENSPSIPYPLGISHEAKNTKEVKYLKEWILGEKGQQILEKYGFNSKP